MELTLVLLVVLVMRMLGELACAMPGGGSFYGREYGLGVVNLLFWPLSSLWDPVSGHSAGLVR